MSSSVAPAAFPPKAADDPTTAAAAAAAAAAAGRESAPDDERILYEETYHPPFLWALALIPPLLPLFWTYRVKVTAGALEFGYSTDWTSHVVHDRRHAVKSVRVIPTVRGLWEWGGWGIRYKWSRERGGEWGYIPKDGSGICVGLVPPAAGTDGGSDNPPSLVYYTFLCHDAERVAQLLRGASSSADAPETAK